MGLHIQWVDPASKLELQTNAGLILTPGDICYWDGTDVIVAKADAVATAAEFIAVNRSDGDSDENGDAIVAKRCTIYDDAAGFTVGPYYLSGGTAGAYTSTRVTAAGELRQQVGYAHTTSYLSIEIKERYEVTVPWQVIGAEALTVLDSGSMIGFMMNASGELVYLIQNVPENAVRVVISKLFVSVDAIVAATTVDIVTAAALGDESDWDAITVDATLVNQVLDPSGAADDIAIIDLTTNLNATDIFQPGIMLVTEIKSDQAGTDLMLVHSAYTVFECV